MLFILKEDSNGNKWNIRFYHLVKLERQPLKKDPVCSDLLSIFKGFLQVSDLFESSCGISISVLVQEDDGFCCLLPSLDPCPQLGVLPLHHLLFARGAWVAPAG